MRTMADAIRADGKGYLLGPRLPCGYCRNRPAQTQDLCCFCAEDEESREQYAAQSAREDKAPLCGGCDGSGEGAYEGTRCRDCRGKGISREDATSSEPGR